MVIAGVLLAAAAANGPIPDRCAESAHQESFAAARVDTLFARTLDEPRTPIAPLGTIESATSISFARCSRTPSARDATDTTLDVAASNTGAADTGAADTGAAEAVASAADSIVAPVTEADTTFRSRRPRAIEYSDAYHTRLKIHQIGAYAMLPLFVSEYIIGQKLLTSTNRSHGLKSAHSLIAAGLGIVFVSNTITGAWNFWDARKDPNGRTRREIHSALMLASDVGMVATALSASSAKRNLVDARRHRTIAISSIALSAIGSGMMWLWRN